jgi:nitrite reductase/ring-hydroxylating ferredoxin subunit
MSDGFAVVGKMEAFPEGKLRKVQVAGEDVLVANIGGRIYAIANTCTHRGAQLHEGEREGTTVVCPFHGGQFDITTGKVVSPPPMRDELSFEVRIVRSDVILKKR